MGFIKLLKVYWGILRNCFKFKKSLTHFRAHTIIYIKYVNSQVRVITWNDSCELGLSKKGRCFISCLVTLGVLQLMIWSLTVNKEVEWLLTLFGFYHKALQPKAIICYTIKTYTNRSFRLDATDRYTYLCLLRATISKNPGGFNQYTNSFKVYDLNWQNEFGHFSEAI